MDEDQAIQPSVHQQRAQEEAEDFFKSVKIKTSHDSLPPQPKKTKSLKLILIILTALLILAAIPLTLTLVKQRQEIRKEAVGPETLIVNVIEDDKGEYGIHGEKTDSNAYCCVNYDILEVPSPKESFVEVDKITIESHDHTADVGIQLDVHTEAGWQNVDRFDVSTGNQEICNERGSYYPDHGYPDNPNSQTHNEPDSCYKTHITSLGCQKIDKIRMKFYSVHLDPERYDPEKAEKDKGEHVHIKNVIWHYCPAYEISCDNIIPYTSDWQEIGDDDWANLVLPTTVNFVVEGSCEEPQGVTKARFRLDGGSWQMVDEPSQKYHGNFYWPYLITEPGGYSVEAEVYNPGLGWR